MDETLEKVFQRKNVDFFWEYDAAFGLYFLKKVFSDWKFFRKECESYIQKDGKTFQFKLREVKKIPAADGKEVKTKAFILKQIKDGLSSYSIAATSSKGKFLYFPLGKFICELEIIEKRNFTT